MSEIGSGGKNSMKPLERINALLAGDPVDRVPVWLWLLSPTLAASSVGYSLVDIFYLLNRRFRLSDSR